MAIPSHLCPQFHTEMCEIPLLRTLYTYGQTPTLSNNVLIKFANDITEEEHTKSVWYSENNFALNISKTTKTLTDNGI